MNKMQIGVDQIVNIGQDLVVDPKKLLCSICFTLNINARECLNKRCKKLFCLSCINSLKNVNNMKIDENSNKNTNAIPCPFCRVEADFYKADETLNKLISNIKFECFDNCCTGKYTLEEYIDHNINRKNLKYCYKCKDSTFLQYSKCSICNNIFCNDCNITNLCIYCKFIVCSNCLSFKYKNRENFLCGVCEPKCYQCTNIRNEGNVEANEICGICNKFLCIECSVECQDCKLIMCKDNKYCKATCNHINKDIINNLNIENKCKHKIYLECDICFPRCKYKLKDNSEAVKDIKDKVKTNKSTYSF